MITAQELNKRNYPTTPAIDANLAILLDKLNQVRTAYAKPMTVTSGLRSNTQQADLVRNGMSTAFKSNHLTGSAADIFDKDGDLWKWCMINMDLLVTVGLWLEDRDATPSWVHFQIVPPASGKRIFKP